MSSLLQIAEVGLKLSTTKAALKFLKVTSDQLNSVHTLQEQIQAIRAKAASQEDRQVIDRLLDNAITMAHVQLPSQPQSQFHQLPLQV